MLATASITTEACVNPNLATPYQPSLGFTNAVKLIRWLPVDTPSALRHKVILIGWSALGFEKQHCSNTNGVMCVEGDLSDVGTPWVIERRSRRTV